VGIGQIHLWSGIVVARYKVHKQRADKWDDGYYRPYSSDPDSIERQQARKEIMQGLQDNEDFNHLLLKAEIQWEEEERRSWECWMRQKADPENYVCRCFEHTDIYE
jgi:hypothetical protein